MKTLREALLEQPPQMLRAIAESNGLDLPEGGSRDQWAGYLANDLARADVVHRAWQSLSDVERGILQGMMRNAGRAKAFQLVRDYGEIRPFGPVALAREKPWLSPANPLEHLWYRGLIQRAFDVVGDYRGEIFFVPEEMLAHMPKPGTEAPPIDLKPVLAPESIADDGEAAVWDVFNLMAFVAREEPAADEDGALRPEDALKLNAQFVIQEEVKPQKPGRAAQSPSPLAGRERAEALPRLFFVTRIARAARLVRTMNRAGLRLGSEARVWLRAPGEERRRRLFDAWQRDRVWNELRFVPTLRLEDTGWRNDPRLARDAVLRHLAGCRPGVWYSLVSFVGEIRKSDPDFQRPDGDYDRWHIRDRATGKLLTGFSNWAHVEGALIAFLVQAPLRWLGIVRLNAGPDDASVFQMSPYGARALGVAMPERPEPRPAKFIVQADLDVLVPQEAPLYARFQLERMAERVRWDRMSTYRLTRESVTRLLRRQVAIDQVLSFLKRASREPFPANVEFTLREWAEKYGEVSLRRAAILHTRDRKLLRELQHHPEVKEYIVEVLSSTVALVDAERMDELQDRLQRLGYSPRVEPMHR